MKRLVLLVALVLCAGCSTMKDVGVGMQVGGGFGGVSLLGSIIEAAADLGSSGSKPEAVTSGPVEVEAVSTETTEEVR